MRDLKDSSDDSSELDLGEKIGLLVIFLDVEFIILDYIYFH